MSGGTLYYVHDPMCSWCWAFETARRRLLEQLPPGISVVRLLGGLAADTDAAMPPAMREQIQAHWRNIEEKLPFVRFNYAFWEQNRPRRSTYPACRAVLAARSFDAALDEAMTAAIQQAYYRQARNPSERDTLVALAEQLGLDGARFASVMEGASTREALANEIAAAREMRVDSFPALVLQLKSGRWRVPVEYQESNSMLDTICMLLED